MDQIVSDLVRNSCRLYPKPNISKFSALYLQCRNTHADGDYNRIAISSGSASEFYIEPMLSCIGDIDVMWHRNDQLAIPAGYPVPPCLPAEFHREVLVYELIDTQFPCYVVAQIVCKLIKSINCDNHYITSHAMQGIASMSQSPFQHGPAERTMDAVAGPRGSERLSVDSVLCIRCLEWPPQAADWPTRRRINGWPKKKTIDTVVSNGCDVVKAAHPQCSYDHWMKTHQWRLSFSRAETVLLDSWSPNQQIVYHMLRIFIKKTGKDATEKIPSTYFTKTLMLWACELYSQTKWNSLCAVSICTRLLHTMAAWMKSGIYQVYFVPQCNLLDSINDVDIDFITDYFYSLNDNTLSEWFVENYVYKCADQCEVVYDVCSLSALNKTVSDILNWKQANEIEMSYMHLTQQACANVERLWNENNLAVSADTYKLPIEQLQAVDPPLIDFCKAVRLLNVTSKLLQRHNVDVGLADVLLTTMGVEIGNTDSYPADTDLDIDGHSISRCNLFTVSVTLMQTLRHLPKNTSTLLLTEIAKVYLHLSYNCLQTRCSDFHSYTNNMLLIYMAALYCSTRQYQLALKQCIMAVTTPIPVQGWSNLYYLELKFMPQLNENVDNIFYLIMFYENVRKSALQHSKKHKPITHYADSVTPELFAYYLFVLCLSNEHVGVYCKVQRKFMKEYKERLHNSKTLFIADVLLYYVTQRQIISSEKVQLYSIVDRCDNISTRTRSVQFNTDRLTQLLIQSAVEHLTEFRQVVSRDYSSIRTIVTTDYQAMYAYKCGFYQECFQLCNDIIFRLFHVVMATDSIRIPSPLLLLLDDDCVSLFGLAILCGTCNDPRVSEPVAQLTIAMYLLAQSTMRLKVSATLVIDVLRRARGIHNSMRIEHVLNRALVEFVYRKTIVYFDKRRVLRRLPIELLASFDSLN